MGLPTDVIISPHHHWESFKCSICNQLAPLGNALITGTCNHIFCAPCLQGHLRDHGATKRPGKNGCVCPFTHTDPSTGECIGPGCDTILGLNSAKPLEKENPLAWKILSRVQLKCPLAFRQSGGSNGSGGTKECCWVGDYSKMPDHLRDGCYYDEK